MRVCLVLLSFLTGCQIKAAHVKVDVGCLFHHVRVETDIVTK